MRESQSEWARTRPGWSVSAQLHFGRGASYAVTRNAGRALACHPWRPAPTRMLPSAACGSTSSPARTGVSGPRSDAASELARKLAGSMCRTWSCFTRLAGATRLRDALTDVGR